MPSVSVVIPALNEDARIGAAIGSAFAAGAAEVIVADGGSTDRTIAMAREHGARIIDGERMRARQMNRGAEAATGDVLIFLHADTLLPIGACESVLGALDAGVLFGGFRVMFREKSWKLRVVALMINLRTALTRCPWGDQAQFIRRDVFLASGGYRQIAIMEDYELAIRMKHGGGTTVLAEKVQTSGRRFLTKGVLRTAAINWRIIFAWRRGADPEQLARMYR